MRDKKTNKRGPAKSRKASAPKIKPAAKIKPVAKARSKPKATATVVKPCQASSVKSVPILIRTKFWGRQIETHQTMCIPVVDRDTIRLDMTIDLRKTEYLVISPMRRDISDVSGMLSDAEALANDQN